MSKIERPAIPVRLPTDDGIDYERAAKTASGWRRKLTQEEDIDNLSSAYLAQAKELTVLRKLAKNVDIWDQMLGELDTAYDFSHIMREINIAIDEWRSLCALSALKEAP